MNIALVLQHKLLIGIQRFMHMGRHTGTSHMLPPSSGAAGSHLHPFAPMAPCPSALRGVSAGVASQRHLVEKVVPLRVLRVVESGMPRSSTGRMVISGRMADVCAELDRLVEREAALHYCSGPVKFKQRIEPDGPGSSS
jgi:hypothetical protein